MPSFTKFLCAVNELVNIPADFATQLFRIQDRKFQTLFALRLLASSRAIPTIAGLRELADETGDGSLPRLVLTWPEEGR